MGDILLGGYMANLPGMLTIWNERWEEALRFAPGMAALWLVLLYTGSLLARGPRNAARGSFDCRRATGWAVRTVVTAVFIVIAATVPALEARADQAPVMTLELAIVHGKASVPKEKREVSKVRLDAALDGRERRIQLPLRTAYSTTSSAGHQTTFIDSPTPEFRVTARPAPGGAEVKAYVIYRVPSPVPESYASAAVSPKTAIRGFDIQTQLALPAKEGASVEVGSIEDPVTDRAWSATITVVGVKGAVSPGVLPKNATFTAKVEENEGKKSTTVLRLTSSKTYDAEIVDKLSVPYATISPSGTSVQFMDLPVELEVGVYRKESGSTPVRLRIARQRSVAQGKESWPVFETDQITTLAPGTPSDLGMVSEGGRTIRATLEERTE